MELWSKDRRFGLSIPNQLVNQMSELCFDSYPVETGGILLGQYNNNLDCAFVTELTGPPKDSKSGRTWFERGIKGLQRKVDLLWRHKSRFYLGEWHFHPGGTPLPSPTDVDQIQELADSHRYNCPEPLLLIIGGHPPDHYSFGAYVFRRNQGYVQLHD